MSKNKNFLEIIVTSVAIGANVVLSSSAKGATELGKAVVELSGAIMETMADKAKFNPDDFIKKDKD
jgi:hypothetical protein